MTANEWLKYFRMKLRRYMADAPNRAAKAQRQKAFKASNPGKRVEWMDRLDLADQYRAKREAEGWKRIHGNDDRTGALWEVQQGNETIYIKATMDDWNGQITERKVKKPSRLN